MPTLNQQLEAGVKHLRRRDPVMRQVIRDIGPAQLKCDRNRFRMLAHSILSQQVSTAAARTIRGRLAALVGEPFEPARLGALSFEQLRSAGLSGNKAKSMQDLCAAAIDGRVRLDRIGRKDDEEVIAELIQIRGIGRWTAQMFLIFSLGRMDVFPIADLGVRAAIRDLYGLPELPDDEAGHAIAAPWRPYASVASWYCWRSLERSRELAKKLG